MGDALAIQVSIIRGLGDQFLCIRLKRSHSETPKRPDKFGSGHTANFCSPALADHAPLIPFDRCRQVHEEFELPNIQAINFSRRQPGVSSPP
jgi:hypothetical protein